MEHILLVLFVCKIIDVFPLWPRCIWLVLFSWLCLRCAGEGGVLFSVCFSFAAIFVFMLVSSLVFESISFWGFYWGPLPGVDSGPLPVPFCWCPPPCPGGCLCTPFWRQDSRKGGGISKCLHGRFWVKFRLTFVYS